jgi:GPR1/FUN34/yaaH family protein
MSPRTPRGCLFDDRWHLLFPRQGSACFRHAVPFRGDFKVSIPVLEPLLVRNGHTEGGSGQDAPPPAPVANAGPLGLSAFAITTFLLSMVNAGFIATGAEPIVFGMALMVGGLAQVLAGTNTPFGRSVLPIHSLS